MKISKVSTGNKLDLKTFGDLKPGDKLYLASPIDKSIEDVTFTIKCLIGYPNYKLTGYTDLNPAKKVSTLCDIELKIETRFGGFNCYLPYSASYFVCGDEVFATTQELLLQTIKKYNIESQLV